MGFSLLDKRRLYIQSGPDCVLKWDPASRFQICRLTSTGNPVMEITQLEDRLIYTIWFSVLVMQFYSVVPLSCAISWICHHVSRSFGATRFIRKFSQILWFCRDVSATLLPTRQSHCKPIKFFKSQSRGFDTSQEILWLRYLSLWCITAEELWPPARLWSIWNYHFAFFSSVKKLRGVHFTMYIVCNMVKTIQ